MIFLLKIVSFEKKSIPCMKKFGILLAFKNLPEFNYIIIQNRGLHGHIKSQNIDLRTTCTITFLFHIRL